jgi:NADH:ubiquinone oxidoreductase subunit 3 (subunit A)
MPLVGVKGHIGASGARDIAHRAFADVAPSWKLCYNTAHCSQVQRGDRRDMELINPFTSIGLFVVIAVVFPLIALGLAWVLRPKKPNPVKSQTYECGLETYGDTWVQFRAQYYLFALVFVIFDIETVFLYPWAVAYNKLGLFALVEMFIFLAILVVGLVYAWRKGALEWM